MTWDQVIRNMEGTLKSDFVKIEKVMAEAKAKFPHANIGPNPDRMIVIASSIMDDAGVHCMVCGAVMVKVDAPARKRGQSQSSYELTLDKTKFGFRCPEHGFMPFAAGWSTAED